MKSERRKPFERKGEVEFFFLSCETHTFVQGHPHFIPSNKFQLKYSGAKGRAAIPPWLGHNTIHLYICHLSSQYTQLLRVQRTELKKKKKIENT